MRFKLVDINTSHDDYQSHDTHTSSFWKSILLPPPVSTIPTHLRPRPRHPLCKTLRLRTSFSSTVGFLTLLFVKDINYSVSINYAYIVFKRLGSIIDKQLSFHCSLLIIHPRNAKLLNRY